ncbi:MAG: transglutaminase family protein, partial [Planctomycetota bacterium]
RRAGLDAWAVSLPDYFLVRIHGRRPVLLDPFHGGRSVTKADCLRYLRGPGGGAARSAQLVDIDDLDLLCGLLDDLQRAFSRSHESEFRAALRRSRRFLSA